MEKFLLNYVTNAAWQIPLLAWGAWLFIRISKFGPRMQHCIWLIVLVLAVSLPLRGVRAGLAPVVQAACTNCSMAASPIPGREALPRDASVTRLVVADPRRPTELFTLPQPTLRLSPAATDWLASFYFGIVIFSFYRILAAWRRARRLVLNADVVALPPQWNTIFQDSGRFLDASLPQLRSSSDVRSPVIVGVMHPVLLLPKDFNLHSQVEVQAAFFHELAHVRRHDYLGNLLCQLASLPVAWHPLIYGVQQRIRRTREMVCDDIAARAMRSEIGYAKCLLAMARRTLRESELAEAGQAVGLFGDNVLEERIMHLMQEKNTMTMQVKLVRVASGAVAMILAIAMAAGFHVTPALAQTSATVATVPQPLPPAPDESVKAVAPIAPIPPVAPATPDATPFPRKKKVAGHHSRNFKGKSVVIDGSGKSFLIDVNGGHAMSPEHRAQFQNDMAALDARIAEATKQLNSPNFKQQMAELAKQQANLRHLDLAQMQRQIAAATAKLNSPEFQQQMADLQKQVESGAMQRSMENARKQMEFAEKQQEKAIQNLDMSKVQQQIDATAKINSPEFKRQMEKLQKQIESGAMQHSMEEASKRLKAAEDQMRQAQTK